MLFYLAYKNIVSRKSSFVIILFIAFAISLMVLVNSIFDSTENGIESVYSRSFTGDIVIRPAAKMPLSLFGDETPITGKLTEIPRLIPYADIVEHVKENARVSSFVPQISGRIIVESDSSDKNMETLFGVNADEYFKVMTSIKILEGKPYGAGERGSAVSKNGDEIQFLVEDKMSLRIRAAKISCIYEYEIKNETLDNIILVDPFTMRSLLDMTDTSQNIDIDENSQDLLGDDDLDSMFEDAEDFSAESVIVEDKKDAVEANDAFMKMFCGDMYDIFASRKEGLSGASLDRIISFSDIFSQILKSGGDIHKSHYQVKNKLYDISAFTIEDGEIVGAVITDVTKAEIDREKIAAKAREVITKNITKVQEIACLLGEHMVETEVLLKSIAEDYSNDNANDDGEEM